MLPHRPKLRTRERGSNSFVLPPRKLLSLKCPPDAAAKVALGQISAWLQSEALGSLEKIILCAHGPVNQKAVKAAIEEWVKKDLNPR